ncbi:hypothetical protein BASA81_003708 [Batrachochytrium salamandrivorans]|nr:hypothetical protein BASA81_003708 [Batrachochytrium salamandrivorans]
MSPDQVVGEFAVVLKQARSAEVRRWGKTSFYRALDWALLANRALARKHIKASCRRSMLLEEIMLNPYCPARLFNLCAAQLSSPRQRSSIELKLGRAERESLALEGNVQQAAKRLSITRLYQLLQRSLAARERFEAQLAKEGSDHMHEWLREMAKMDAHGSGYVSTLLARRHA